MALPQHITFTGLDRHTDLERVRELSASYPIEWGVLMSPSRTGNEPRYPGLNTIEVMTGLGVRLAAHLCGGYAREALNVGYDDVWERRLEGFGRAQLNYVPNPQQWPGLDKGSGLPLGHSEAIRFSADWGKPVIVQHRTLTFPYSGPPSYLEKYPLQYLFDKSGGRGEQPANWPQHPGGERLVGYAGGLGPDNVKEQLARMDTSGPHWLDMEGRVRTEQDWLDLDKVERVCQEIYGSSQQA